jgi:hypothetical protein
MFENPEFGIWIDGWSEYRAPRLITSRIEKILSKDQMDPLDILIAKEKRTE